MHPVIGNLQVVTPCVDEDAAAALGAVDHAEAVNARRIAEEVAGIRVVLVVARSHEAILGGQRNAAGRERGLCRSAAEGVDSGSAGDVDALAEYGDGRSFIGAHQAWLD